MTSLAIGPAEFDLFRQLIEKECGISIGKEKAYLLESRLSRMLLENDCEDFGAFYKKTCADKSLRDKIIDAMTTNETLWFRDNAPFMVLKEHLLPKLVEQVRKGERSQVRIWSAACSSGQEPYSIAMLAHEMAYRGLGSELLKGGLSITATDLSNTVLMLAKAGRYDALSISRGMPEDLLARYFRQEGRVYLLEQKIKDLVSFQQLNLMNSFTHLGRFDIVMLRNVAIYFSGECKTDLFKRITRVLNPGGYLFLGASESLQGYSTDFERREYRDAVFYQLK